MYLGCPSNECVRLTMYSGACDFNFMWGVSPKGVSRGGVEYVNFLPENVTAPRQPARESTRRVLELEVGPPWTR